MKLRSLSLGAMVCAGLVWSSVAMSAIVEDMGSVVLDQSFNLRGATTPGTSVDKDNKENFALSSGTYDVFSIKLGDNIRENASYTFDDENIVAVIWKTAQLDRAEDKFGWVNVFPDGLEFRGNSVDSFLFSGGTITWEWDTARLRDPADGVLVLANPVPLPAALPLFGSALGLLGFLGHRRRKQEGLAA